MHTPDHTPNSISLLVTDTVRSAEPEMILTGELLFVGDIGRPDLQGNGFRLFDVRTPAEWHSGPIADAVHCPLADILDNRLPDASKEEKLILICGSGYRSNIAASILRNAGYSKVSSLVGGLFAWSNGGFPIVA